MSIDLAKPFGETTIFLDASKNRVKNFFWDCEKMKSSTACTKLKEQRISKSVIYRASFYGLHQNITGNNH